MVHALILGGHGKIALHLTKILADRSHNVTSIIRNPHHGAAISAISPLVVPRAESLEDATDASAEAMMDGVDWVIWSAGAGGKGGKERTKAVDELAAKRFIAAAIRAPSVKRFLMVSACCARRSPASWWDQQDVKSYHGAWDAIGVYCDAKCVADEFLFEESRKTEKEGWEDICLRPGTLTDEAGCGKVDLGRSKAAGGISREDVAMVAAELLERGGSGGLWLDVVKGEERVSEAVERCVREKVTARE